MEPRSVDTHLQTLGDLERFKAGVDITVRDFLINYPFPYGLNHVVRGYYSRGKVANIES